MAEWKEGGAIRIGPDGDLDWPDLSLIFDQPTKSQVWLLVVYTCGRKIPYPLRFRPAGDSFLDRSTGLHRRSFQMEPDQKLYAVYPGEKCPAGAIPQQPDGYPMEAEGRTSTNHAQTGWGEMSVKYPVESHRSPLAFSAAGTLGGPRFPRRRPEPWRIR
jgi:hypothetical protein